MIPAIELYADISKEVVSDSGKWKVNIGVELQKSMMTQMMFGTTLCMKTEILENWKMMNVEK